MFITRLLRKVTDLIFIPNTATRFNKSKLAGHQASFLWRCISRNSHTRRVFNNDIHCK